MANAEMDNKIAENEAADAVRDKVQYELALLLKNEDDASALAEMLRQHNCEITSEPRARKLALAYKIKGNTEAVFVTCLFRAVPSDAKQLEHGLRMRPAVIRSMIVRASTQSGSPAVATPSVLPERPGGRGASLRGTGALRSEPKKQPAREPLSNEALENLLKEI